MSTRYLSRRRPARIVVFGSAALFAAAIAACDSPTDPGFPDLEPPTVEPPPPPPPPPPAVQGGAGNSTNSYSKGAVQATGTVTETADGMTVDGAVSLTAAGNTFEFTNAKMQVQYDASGNVKAMSGTAQIPSPHERIQFADPVEADIGLFSGAWLNANRDLPILLKDDTDYFVYHVNASYEMRVATGETSVSATKPIKVQAPFGGTILMIVDYTDPMYFVYGAIDLLGAAGFGWSLNGRIPFTPDLPVNGLGAFEGRNTRAGTFPVYKVISVTGQMVDNETTEVHLTTADPFASNVSHSYQAGYNGQADLDLGFKDFIGLEIPLATASGGVYGAASVQNGLGAHAYIRGRTADFSWWPTFLPFKPAHEMAVQGFVQSSGDFGIDMEGQYGWELASHGTFAMTGRFRMAPDSVGLTGGLVAGSQTWEVSGGVTSRATSLDIKPPAALLNTVQGDVQGRIDTAIQEAEAAWQDLQDATGDYQIELSLRGLRTQLPGIVDYAMSEVNRQISSRLSSHRNAIYYSSLRNAVYGQRDAYFSELRALKAAAQEIRDNDATRAAIERALRRVAARKTMTITYRHKVLGITVKTVTVTVRVLTDAQAARILQAANDVKHIKATSDLKLSMQQIYDQVPAKRLFEQVRDGVLRIPTLQSFGMEVVHATTAISVYATLGQTRHSLGQVSLFDVPSMAAAAADLIWRQIN